MSTAAIVTQSFWKKCNCAFFVLIIILHFWNHSFKRPIAAFNFLTARSMLPDRTLIFVVIRIGRNVYISVIFNCWNIINSYEY
jgi:hypothetical protein